VGLVQGSIFKKILNGLANIKGGEGQWKKRGDTLGGSYCLIITLGDNASVGGTKGMTSRASLTKTQNFN